MWQLVVGVALALLVLIQAVPYGRDHTNPPVRLEPSWDSARTRSLAARVCFDCHSNQTVWPWYAHIAPISWRVQRDVDEGRRALNFSEWDRRQQQQAVDAMKALRRGDMPPRRYIFAHADSGLSISEKLDLLRGLEATFGSERARRQRGGPAGGTAIAE